MAAPPNRTYINRDAETVRFYCRAAIQSVSQIEKRAVRLDTLYMQGQVQLE